LPEAKPSPTLARARPGANSNSPALFVAAAAADTQEEEEEANGRRRRQMVLGQEDGKGGLGSADWERRREVMEREEVTVFESCTGEDKGEERIGELRYEMKQRCC